MNRVNFGDFSNVATQETDGKGTNPLSSGFGFGDNILNTGLFASKNAGTLSSLYATLASGMIQFKMDDLTPGDQCYDFTQGLDSSVINVGSGPVVTPPGGGTSPSPVPEPSTLADDGNGAGRRRRVRCGGDCSARNLQEVERKAASILGRLCCICAEVFIQATSPLVGFTALAARGSRPIIDA